METDREAIEKSDDADYDDIIDAECDDCGRDYYSEYIRSVGGDDVCLDCYLTLTR